MPVSAMDAAIGDQFLVGTETETAGSFENGDVVPGVLLTSVTGFVTNFLFRTDPEDFQ
jgi:hypothetical protein